MLKIEAHPPLMTIIIFVVFLCILVYFFEKEKKWLWYQIIELRQKMNTQDGKEWLNHSTQTVVPGVLNHYPSNPSEILLLKLDHIGDIILTLPALRAIRARFPNTVITLACGSWAIDVLKNENVVDHFIAVNYLAPGKTNAKSEICIFKSAVKKKSYALAIDLRPFGDTLFLLQDVSAEFKMGFFSEKSSTYSINVLDLPPQNIHISQKINRMAQHLGCEITDPYPSVKLTLEEVAFATQFFDSHNLNHSIVIGIHPFANVPTRNWGLENYAKVATYLVEKHNYKILWFAVKQSIDFRSFFSETVWPSIIVISETTLRESLAIMARCTVFVSNNSGPMHMASAAGCPTLGVFSGVEIPLEWGPFGKKNRTIMADIWCIRCHQSECSHKSCLTSISPPTVVNEITRMVHLNQIS